MLPPLLPLFTPFRSIHSGHKRKVTSVPSFASRLSNNGCRLPSGVGGTKIGERGREWEKSLRGHTNMTLAKFPLDIVKRTQLIRLLIGFSGNPPTLSRCRRHLSTASSPSVRPTQLPSSNCEGVQVVPNGAAAVGDVEQLFLELLRREENCVGGGRKRSLLPLFRFRLEPEPIWIHFRGIFSHRCAPR